MTNFLVGEIKAGLELRIKITTIVKDFTAGEIIGR